MPLGSSSAAPVINPGPSRRRIWMGFFGKPERRAAVSVFPTELGTQFSEDRDNIRAGARTNQDFSFPSPQQSTVPGRYGAQSLQELYVSRKLHKINDSR